MPIIVLCRFIPGGRTAVTLSCGVIGFPARRFVAATAMSGVIWASFAFFLGRLGGSAFEDSPWAGLLAALAASVALALVIEGVRRVRSRWQARQPAQKAPDHRGRVAAAAGKGPGAP
jgi:membrane protein DedA with SNARE-associated domain